MFQPSLAALNVFTSFTLELELVDFHKDMQIYLNNSQVVRNQFHFCRRVPNLKKQLFCDTTRPSERWISSIATYKAHIALISALMLERDRKSEKI